MSEGRLTRRQAIKYGGVGAIAFTTPLVWTATASASANTKICLTRAVRDDVAACGVCNVLPTCSPDNSCICFVTTSDCCFCVAPRSCAAAEPCRKNSDCPPGFKCVHSCCDAAGFGPLCGMPCGSPGAPAAADLRGQMTQAGQL